MSASSHTRHRGAGGHKHHGPMVVPYEAMVIEIRFSDDVFVRWPSWNDSDAWDVWDATHVRQGAHRIETVTRFNDAVDSARALVRKYSEEAP